MQEATTAATATEIAADRLVRAHAEALRSVFNLFLDIVSENPERAAYMVQCAGVLRDRYDAAGCRLIYVAVHEATRLHGRPAALLPMLLNFVAKQACTHPRPTARQVAVQVLQHAGSCAAGVQSHG